jgi:hypothetical protein
MPILNLGIDYKLSRGHDEESDCRKIVQGEHDHAAGLEAVFLTPQAFYD